MSFPQKDNFSAPRMFIMITKAEEEKKLKEIFDEIEIPIYYQCRGQGTAPSDYGHFRTRGDYSDHNYGFFTEIRGKQIILKNRKSF